LEDYYQILGIEKDASSKEIKDAFRKLAKEHHPDRQQGSDEMKYLKKLMKHIEHFQILKKKYFMTISFFLSIYIRQILHKSQLVKKN